MSYLNERGTITLTYQKDGRWRKPSYSLTRQRFECDCEEREAFLHKGEVAQICSHIRKMIEVFELVHDKSTQKIRTINHGIMTVEVIDYT